MGPSRARRIRIRGLAPRSSWAETPYASQVITTDVPSYVPKFLNDLRALTTEVSSLRTFVESQDPGAAAHIGNGVKHFEVIFEAGPLQQRVIDLGDQHATALTDGLANMTNSLAKTLLELAPAQDGAFWRGLSCRNPHPPPIFLPPLLHAAAAPRACGQAGIVGRPRLGGRGRRAAQSS